MSKQMMMCGHSANATDGDGNPVCAICFGIPEATIVNNNPINLTGRKARCSYYGKTFTHRGRRVTCTGEVDSKVSLAFFEHCPDKEYDNYYCGCFGWD